MHRRCHNESKDLCGKAFIFERGGNYKQIIRNHLLVQSQNYAHGNINSQGELYLIWGLKEDFSLDMIMEVSKLGMNSGREALLERVDCMC